MIGWQFARARDGWQWQRLGEVNQLGTSSTRIFPSLLECLEDAANNGYSVSMPADSECPNRRFGD